MRRQLDKLPCTLRPIATKSRDSRDIVASFSDAIHPGDGLHLHMQTSFCECTRLLISAIGAIWGNASERSHIVFTVKTESTRPDKI